MSAGSTAGVSPPRAFAMALARLARAAPARQVPLAADLQADGRLSRERKAPLVILFSLPGCPYCEIVRRSHLAAMLRDPRQARRAIIRQIDIGVRSRRSSVLRASAPPTRPSPRAHDMRAAPVVAFWDANGKPAAESLKGMLLPDFYFAYLEAAIDSARARLAAQN